jgi:hypothetical protein
LEEQGLQSPSGVWNSPGRQKFEVVRVRQVKRSTSCQKLEFISWKVINVIKNHSLVLT